ncbi:MULTISPECIES: restriction endonuclease subunit S [Lactococcus]
MAKIDDSVKKKVPELRFPGFTDDWEERKLSDIVVRLTKSSNNNQLPKVEFEDIIAGEGRLNKDISRKFDDRKGTLFEPDNILYGKLRPYLKNWLFSDFKGIALGDFWVFKSINSEPKFVYSLIQADNYQRVANDTSGTKMPRSDWKKVSSSNFSIPTSLEEQQKIGSFFKQLDNTIALHQRKLDLLKEQKKGYLQKMFPKNGAKVPELRFAGFADDWEERKLIDVKDNEDRYSYTGGPFGSDLKSSDYTEIGVRIIQLQNIGDGKFVNDYKIYTSEEKARSLNSNLIYPGEIIIAKMADPLARATILPKIEPKYLMASDGIRLKINTDYFDNYYILTLINSDVFRKEALNNSTGTTRKRIGLVTLGNLPMMIPSFEEQQKIGSFFKQLDDTIALHQRKLDLLKEQKKGFLQKMFV